MGAFDGKVAIVTGGASGIGLAIARRLVAEGCRVLLADVDGDGAERAARAMEDGERVEAARVDVTDAEAVRACVEQVAARHGRLDLLFNNAGIVTFGEVRDMSLSDWMGMVNVNLIGVVHGVAAAYPLMVRQGFGHIVNTASAAGLGPTPGAVTYAMTKHGVVGLSVSLRAEAAAHGVKVSVVCPGFIDTPIKERATYLNTDLETALETFPFKLHAPDDLARAVVRGVARNKAIIVFTILARAGWYLYRLSPSLAIRLMQLAADRSPLLGRH
jgi:NAD(P)-dependent dehydrogenase (short-subunit alcohol dehydrogenase family)